eukprot:CAMPEP_0180619172 /NCGR_PEP_ID=MMETSP1037_2-20121125/33956_1 /TAXON_ID=632150 /ORGANISM="Azadinium spinosum, Strain 3D9" /LENGTH=66 /DNA_ID=CAMNT_0022639229 /DNA_START=1316 /DNA_END=1516 /DNA_ORIENTATION=+
MKRGVQPDLSSWSTMARFSIKRFTWSTEPAVAAKKSAVCPELSRRFGSQTASSKAAAQAQDLDLKA